MLARVDTSARLCLADLDRAFAGSALAQAELTVFTSLAQSEPAYRQATARCACHAFQLFEFVATWMKTVGAARAVSPCIVHLADRDGRPLLLLPLGVFRTAGVRSLQFLGGDLCDYTAPVVDADFARAISAQAFRRLWRVILRQLPAVDVVWLPRLPADIGGASNPMLHLPGLRHRENGHMTVLPASFEAYRAPRSTQFFARNRNLRRRIEKRAPLRFSVPEDAAGRQAVVAALLRQKSQWLKSSALHDYLARPEYRRFYEELTARPLAEGRVVAGALSAGEEIIAATWSLVLRGRIYMLVMSREAAWNDLGAGRLSIESTLQWCIAQGDIRVFDLTRGDEAFKATWTDEQLPLYEALSFRSARGAVFVALRRAGDWLRRVALLRRLRGRLQRLARRA